MIQRLFTDKYLKSSSFAPFSQRMMKSMIHTLHRFLSGYTISYFLADIWQEQRAVNLSVTVQLISDTWLLLIWVSSRGILTVPQQGLGLFPVSCKIQHFCFFRSSHCCMETLFFYCSIDITLLTSIYPQAQNTELDLSKSKVLIEIKPWHRIWLWWENDRKQQNRSAAQR